jgi:hypothetical protein
MAHAIVRATAAEADLERRVASEHVRELDANELDLVAGGTIKAPRDAQTGQATGRRMWAPIL